MPVVHGKEKVYGYDSVRGLSFSQVKAHIRAPGETVKII